MGGLAEKMTAAGVDTAAARAYTSAAQHLRRVRREPAATLDEFVAVLRADAALLRAVALDYLGRVAADMKGDGSGGQKEPDTQWSRAPAPSPTESAAAGEGQGTLDAQVEAAPPAAADPMRTGGGHRQREAQAPVAPARPQPPPSVPRRGPGSADLVSAIMRQCVLDTLYVNGSKIGDLTAGEALGAADVKERDARTIRALCDGVPPGGRIRDHVDPQEAERRAREALEGRRHG